MLRAFAAGMGAATAAALGFAAGIATIYWLVGRASDRLIAKGIRAAAGAWRPPFIG